MIADYWMSCNEQSINKNRSYESSTEKLEKWKIDDCDEVYDRSEDQPPFTIFWTLDKLVKH